MYDRKVHQSCIETHVAPLSDGALLATDVIRLLAFRVNNIIVCFKRCILYHNTWLVARAKFVSKTVP